MTRLILALALAFSATAAAAQSTVQSRYTDLTGRACKVTGQAREGEGEWTRSVCPGLGGWRARVDYADARDALTLLDPAGRAYELELSRTVGSGFSSLGDRAEWRGRWIGGNFRPHALIFRYSLASDPADPERSTSYLVVTRLFGGRVCVLGSVPPQPRQNEAARRIADRGAGAPCR